MVATTSPAPRAEPSWKRTPSRSTKVHVALLAPAVYDSARSPSTPPVAVRRGRVLFRFHVVWHSIWEVSLLGVRWVWHVLCVKGKCVLTFAWPIAARAET